MSLPNTNNVAPLPVSEREKTMIRNAVRQNADRKPLLFSRQEGRAMIGICQRLFDEQVARGAIGCVRIAGRVLFRQCDIDGFIARCAIPAKPRSGAI